ncbi:MAG: Dabb family protein [Kiritimatiellae bacterium]|jgi:hypothetical protein|nr:Dabb family protein [Kiritimatiellia bacterium]
MIRHAVVFKLKHAKGSKEEIDFLTAGQKLADIASVRNFECLRQVSPKNDYDFGFSMEFESDADYKFYNEHEAHVNFVQTRWNPEVVDCMEIDYEAYSEN